MVERLGNCSRKTAETDVSVSLQLDGKGDVHCDTGIKFLDHMLNLFGAHGLFDISVNAVGDVDVDFHHTTEDVGIALGTAIRQGLGTATGIRRYASIVLPMDEALAQIAIDISGRPHLTFNAQIPKSKVGDFDTELVSEFFQAVSTHAKITIHIDLIRGTNSHHCIEAMFKGFGVALDMATQIDSRKSHVPSTKGVVF